MKKQLTMTLDSDTGNIEFSSDMNAIELMGIAEYLIFFGKLQYSIALKKDLEER